MVFNQITSAMFIFRYTRVEHNFNYTLLNKADCKCKRCNDIMLS